MSPNFLLFYSREYPLSFLEKAAFLLIESSPFHFIENTSFRLPFSPIGFAEALFGKMSAQILAAFVLIAFFSLLVCSARLWHFPSFLAIGYRWVRTVLRAPFLL